MKAVFYTDNLDWCSMTPMGWSYVLLNSSGLIKFGKSTTSLKVRGNQIYGYPDFHFVMAFADVGLEDKLHSLFSEERCCYKPIDRFDIEICEYKTKKEVDYATSLNKEIRYRKTKKELFKLTYSGNLVDYMHQALSQLGYSIVKMECPDDVLPFSSEKTKKIMSELVCKAAAKRKCFTSYS